MKLSPRRRKFAAEYVRNGFNGTKAVFAAGYNMGYNAASVEAHRLLRNPNVQAIVKKALEKAQMSAEDVLDELSEVARAEVRIDAAQKIKALELIGKHHKLFTEKVEHSVLFNEAFSKLKGEFPDVTEAELKTWFAEIIGANVKDLGAIG